MKYVFIICVILGSFFVSACVGQDNTSTKSNINITLDKYSERMDGSIEITVYRSSDGEIRATVYKNTQPNGYDIFALRNEISRLENNPVEWTITPEAENITGHLAISVSISEVTNANEIETNVIPDHYYTSISYPNEGYILTILTNGDNMDWDKHMYVVSKYKL